MEAVKVYAWLRSAELPHTVGIGQRFLIIEPF